MERSNSQIPTVIAKLHVERTGLIRRCLSTVRGSPRFIKALGGTKTIGGFYDYL